MAKKKKELTEGAATESKKVKKSKTEKKAEKKENRNGKKKSLKGLWIALAVVVLLTALGAGAWFFLGDYFLTMKDVTVAGISMEGMTKKEAKKALAKTLSGIYAKETMKVTVLDTTLEIAPKDAAVSVDVNKAVNQAYLKKGVYDISSCISVGKAVDRVVEELCKKYNTNPAETSYLVEGEIPDLKTGAAATGQTLTVTIGHPKMELDQKKLRQAILSGYGTANFAVEGECRVTPPEMLTAEQLYEKYLTAPVDATMDKQFVVSPETYGYSIDMQQAPKLLEGIQYGAKVVLPFAKVAPTVTAESLMAKLFKDVLGECSTPYSGSDNNSRNTNLGLCCKKLNGIILLPGETFSYNKTLGERTAANGWKPAPSYVNGLTVDTYGGGICQGSTTLYNCVLQGDLKILEDHPHGYISSYIGPGLDASVNWPNADFRFTNNTNYPIKIEAYRKGGKMTMRIHGTDEKDYYVKMTYKVVGTRAYATQYEDVDPANNPKGYRDGQQLISPYTGYRVYTWKNKYSKATNQLIETKQERDVTYKHRDRVVVRFINKDVPTSSTPTTSTQPITPTTPTTPTTPSTSTQTPVTPSTSTQTPVTPSTSTQAPTTSTQAPTTTTQAPPPASETP